MLLLVDNLKKSTQISKTSLPKNFASNPIADGRLRVMNS